MISACASNNTLITSGFSFPPEANSKGVSPLLSLALISAPASNNTLITSGFLPYPISNNPDDYGNNEISVGVPSYWAVDESQSTAADQEAAEEFLNWLITSETGQDYYINEFNFIPAFNNFEISPQDNLSNSIMSYMDQGNTLEWMNNYYPSGYFPDMGAALQKYLSGYADQEQFTQEFMNVWSK